MSAQNRIATDTCDAFLLGILPLAMRRGLEIEVKGPVS